MAGRMIEATRRLGLSWARLAARPSLLSEAVATWWAFRHKGGILPSAALLRWRLTTAYGTPDASVRPEDVIAFLSWRRRIRSELRRGA